MFAKNEPNALKDKRNQIERDMKLGKLDPESGNRQKVNIIKLNKNYVFSSSKYFNCIFIYML